MKNKRILSIVLFSAGILIGTTFFGLVAWGDLETALYDSMGDSEQALKSLRCPVAIHPREAAQVSAEIINDTEQPVSVLVRTHITKGTIIFVHEYEERLRLQPGEAAQLSYPITGTDRVYDRVIMVRMHQYRSSPLPSRDATCGILVFNLAGLNGVPAMILIIATSLALTTAGILIWQSSQLPLTGSARKAVSAMKVLGAVMTGGIIAALLNLWLGSFGLLLLVLMLSVVVIAEFTQA